MTLRKGQRILFARRGKVSDAAFLIVVGLMAWLCYRLLLPFLPSLAWALSLAVVALPLHVWLERRIPWRNLSSALTVVVVALILVAPAVFVSDRLVRQAAVGLEALTSEDAAAQYQRLLEQVPRLEPTARWIGSHVDLRAELRRLAERLPDIVQGGAWAAFEMVVAMFCLFFFLRDRAYMLAAVASVLPLSPAEMASLAARITDTIRATVFGTLVVGIVQGTLGGLMFWWLGLASPLLWGVIMSLLAIVPVLGAFVVWIPASLYLALTGSWGKALILAGWGGLVIATVDNLLYPVLVGTRIRQHTLAVFFSFLGGLALFGPSGLVLGPLVLAVSAGLLDIFRARMPVLEQEEKGRRRSSE